MARECAVALSAAVLLALPGSPPSATAVSKTPQPVRIILKLKASLAADVEAGLPDPPSRPARSTASPRVRGFLARHSIVALRPVHEGRLRAKRQRGFGEASLAASVRGRFAARARRHKGRFAPPDLSRTYVVERQVSSREELEGLLRGLGSDPEVEYAEEDRIVQVSLTPNDPYFSSSGSWGQAYDDLYGVKRVGAPGAWDVTAGQGVVVAVVDTGIDQSHPDIANNVWTNPDEVPANGIDDDGNGYVDDDRGWDFIGPSHGLPTPDNDPRDGHGHGTHVAGTIAAEGDNGVGVIGVAWGAKVMAVKGLSDAGFGLTSSLAGALVYAADNGADVINNSWGGPGTSMLIKDAVDYAHSLGAVVVAAAGNSGADAQESYPASFPNVITVAASDAFDSVAYFSNWGKIDVAAPGVDILSLRAAGTSMGRPVGEGYTRADGTSMASPHAAGVCALLLAKNPGWSNEQVRQALRASADDISYQDFDWDSGFGRIDAAQALTIVDPLEVGIVEPAAGSSVAGPATVSGVARGVGFVRYELAWGAGERPTTWTVLQEGGSPVAGGPLGVFDPALLPDGIYTLRLTAWSTSGPPFVDRVQVVVDFARITSPVPPAVPSVAAVFKPGVVIEVQGIATGPSFQGFRIEWARGSNPAADWSTEGIELMGGGAAPLAGGPLGSWDTSAITQADYYAVRLLVDNAGFTSESRTLVYLEPDLLSPYWPQQVEIGALNNVGLVPARNADGTTRLALTTHSSGSGTGTRIWTFSPDGSSRSSRSLDYVSYLPSAAGDIDPAPGEENVVAEAGSVRVIRADGTSYSLMTDRFVNMQYALVLLEDLDGDAQKEVLAVGHDFRTTTSYLFAWKGTSLLAGFPIELADQNWFMSHPRGARVLVADFDGDGAREILVAESPSASAVSLRLFTAQGTPLPFSTADYGPQIFGMATADLDRDGQQEVVVARWNGSAGVMHVLEPDGTERPGWPVVLSSRTPIYLAVADLDRDGQNEIVVSNYDRLHVLRPDGTPLSPAWPRVESLRPFGPVTVADIDGDGYPEILTARYETGSIGFPPTPALLDGLESGGQETAGPAINESVQVAPDGSRAISAFASAPEAQTRPGLVAYYDNRLLALRRDSTIARSWRLLGMNGNQAYYDATPSVGDFDGDGTTDIGVVSRTVIGGATSGLLLDSVVTVFATGAPFRAAANDWPMNYHDPRNTSVFAELDAEPPAVAITSPAAGVRVAGMVTITAAASDDVVVTRVEFLVDGAVACVDPEAPFSCDWDTAAVADGSHSLQARAHDASGSTVSPSVPVTVANPPTVVITAPADGAKLVGTVTISATATDNVAVAQVEFLIDGNLVATDAEAPYAYEWDTLSWGDRVRSIVAVAADAAGNVGVSVPVTVTTANPPVVTLTAPPAGSVVSGVVVVAASASDNVGVARVDFYVDGGLVGTDSAAPYEAAWTSAASPDGGHVLLAKAYDQAGNLGTSPPVAVTSTNGFAVYDQALKAPACAGVGPRCDSGVLLNGRGPVGPEPNQPNTLGGSCPDGASGTYHTDESNDRIRVLTTDGSTLTGGRTVRVEATVWAYSTTSNQLDLYYTGDAANPVWTHLTTLTPSARGGQTLAATYTLPWAGGVHAVRARFRYGGTAGPCGAGTYNDHDDLAFAVGAPPPDTTTPTTSITSPVEGAVVSGTVTVNATATDDVGVTRVELYVDGMLRGTDTQAPFSFAWNTISVDNGGHSLSTKAYDPAGNVGTSSDVGVTVSNLASAVASYDPVLKAPRCSVAASACDSALLLVGRASRGPEPNQPNTIAGSCGDGTAGSFHVDESNDRIKVSTLDGSTLAAGKTVRVEATVWAFGDFASDKLDLYHAADAGSPAWTLLTTLTPPAAGTQVLSTTFVLPAGTLQAVRARFRYLGTAAPCGAGSFNDHDDLVFAVE